MRHSSSDKLWSVPFVTICISSFFVFMTFYALAASLPLYVKEAFGGSEEQVGLTMTLFIVASVAARLFAGRWMETFGERRIVLASLALFAVAALLYENSYSLILLFALRFVHGGSFAVSTASTSSVALRLIPETRKGEGIGYFSLFMSLAMVFGPFVGLTAVSHLGFGFLFGMCAAFAALAFGFAFFTRGREEAKRAVPATRDKLHWRHLIETSAIPIGLAGFVLAFAYSGLTSFVSLYADELSIGSMGGLFFVCFGAMIVLPRPFVGRILDKYGEHVIVYPCIAAFTAGMVLLGIAQSPGMFLLAGGICGLGYGSMLPCFQTVAVKRAGGPPSARHGDVLRPVRSRVRRRLVRPGRVGVLDGVLAYVSDLLRRHGVHGRHLLRVAS
ncbi:MFS transporter [Cohnella sp. GCM10027633]|uniref:MFS transporter n=1 Tax=unclassified Cohnella TaxID=2636738 RepID=UPI0036393686